MNVNDIINKALALLGVTDVTVAAGSADPRLAKLVNAVGVTYLQVITEYAPLEKEEAITVPSGGFNTAGLSEKLYDVVRLIDDSGEVVKCRLQGQTLVAKAGTYRLRYYYLPSSYPAIGGTISLPPQVNETLFARGVAAEYALESMMYEEALLHDRKFKEGLMKALSQHAEKRLTVRRWI